MRSTLVASTSTSTFAGPRPSALSTRHAVGRRPTTLVRSGEGEEISDAMRADLERYQRRQRSPTQQLELDRQQQASSSSQPSASPASPVDSLKETLDKILIADFFLVLFVLAWLGAGVAQAGLSGGESFLLDAWYPLWPLLWQPAIGVLMAGALVSGGVSWLQSQGKGNN